MCVRVRVSRVHHGATAECVLMNAADGMSTWGGMGGMEGGRDKGVESGRREEDFIVMERLQKEKSK